jgi:hypothetical protein
VSTAAADYKPFFHATYGYLWKLKPGLTKVDVVKTVDQ